MKIWIRRTLYNIDKMIVKYETVLVLVSSGIVLTSIAAIILLATYAN